MRNTCGSLNSRHSGTTTTTTTAAPATATIIKLTVNFIRSHHKFSTQTRMIYTCKLAYWSVFYHFWQQCSDVKWNGSEVVFKVNIRTVYVFISVGQHISNLNWIYSGNVLHIYIVQVYFNFNFNFIYKILSRFVNAMIARKEWAESTRNRKIVQQCSFQFFPLALCTSTGTGTATDTTRGCFI